MQQEEILSLKETGQKGDFLLPFVVCKTFLPDFYTTFPMHWHNEMEIVYVDKGEYIETIDFENYHVKKGDIIIVPPCMLHSFKQYDDERAVFRSVLFDLSIVTGNNTDACSIKYFTPFTENRFIVPVVISQGDLHYDELKEKVLTIMRIYSDKEECFELRLKSELFGMFNLLFRYFLESEDNTNTVKAGTTKSVKIILDYIGENYMYPITIEELAETVNLSKHYFMRFFKKYMGMTCIEYINDYRLNIAANLLLTTRMRITEVAVSIGITNLSYFNRIFKKKFHLTPKEYRFNADNT